VPAFLALYEHEGQNFVAFYRAVEAIGQLPLSERTARLDALSASPSNIVSNAAVTNDPPTTHRSHDERRDL
ncbi:MAG: aminopeptidase, partial [Candidatus Competibacter sp.]